MPRSPSKMLRSALMVSLAATACVACTKGSNVASPTSSLGATTASSPTPTSTPPPGPPKNCTASDVSVVPGKFDSGTKVASGTFVFTNTVGASCWMEGFPGLQMLDASGADLKTQVVQDPAPVPVKRFLLKASHSASFSYTYRAIPNGAQQCPSSAAVQISPPRGSASVKVTFAMAPCAGTVSVSAVEPSP
jgi:hypothetical protein